MDFGEHSGVPQRPPASAHLMIDSLDRYSWQFGGLLQPSLSTSTPGNDFTISSQGALLYGYFTRIGITQVLLKYCVPTIVTGVNDTFSISQTGTGGSATFTIPQGFYDGGSIAAKISTLLAASAAPYSSYTCVWNSVTQSLQFASNNGQTFGFQPPLIFGSSNPGLNVRARTNYLLGVAPVNYVASIGGTVGTTQLLAPARLYYTSFVDIVSERLTKYQRVKDSESGVGTNNAGIITVPAINNVVARVYLVAPNTRLVAGEDNATMGSAPIDICIDYNTPKHIRWSPNEAVYEMDFRLYDQFGVPLYWTPSNPTEFLLTMVASET
jgi:hypothetical protein